LSFENGDDSGMVGFAQLYLERFYRAERVGHEGGRIRAPLNDVDLLVVQLVYDVIDTRTAYADT